MIMYYVYCFNTTNKELAIKFIENLLPWTFGQNFSTRLFAQTIIVKICEQFQYHTEHFSILYKSILIALQHDKAKMMYENFMKDIRFNQIKPADLSKSYHLCFEIPQHTDVALDEYWNWNFSSESRPLSYLNLSSRNDNDEKVFITQKQIEEQNKCEKVLNCCENVQKKFITIKTLMPEIYCNQIFNNDDDADDDNDGLIVVASLVTKCANIGGLARTCEINGVSELIIDSIKQIEKQEFQALSMTSEKWLKISEIKPWHLVDYLIDMKNKGYTIIGAEQTAKSVPINSIRFPKKSCLLLG